MVSRKSSSPAVRNPLYDVAFRVGGRYGKFSAYSLRDIATYLTDRYSLTDRELWSIVHLEAHQEILLVGKELKIRRRK